MAWEGKKREMSVDKLETLVVILGRAVLFMDFGGLSVIPCSRVIGTRQGVSEMSSQVLHRDEIGLQVETSV